MPSKTVTYRVMFIAHAEWHRSGTPNTWPTMDVCSASLIMSGDVTIKKAIEMLEPIAKDNWENERDDGDQRDLEIFHRRLDIVSISTEGS